jgi:glycosyltransferase involved in cell wall biosynthesis
MRVLFITSAYPATEDDARGFFIHQLARAIARAGESVTVLAPGAANAAETETRDGVEIHRAQYWVRSGQSLAAGFAGIMPNLRRRPWLAAQVPTLVGALSRKAVKLAEDADLVHAHWVYPAGLAGAIAARRHGLPLVVTTHGTDLALARRVPPLRWLSRRVCRVARAVVAVSQGQARLLEAISVPGEQIRLIPMGVDLTATSEGLAIPTGDEYMAFREHPGLRVVFVGRLIPSKSVDTLLDAHQALDRAGHSIATALVGGGPSEKALRERVGRSRSRNVTFAGTVPPAQVAAWLKASDVVVLPSIHEGRGLVILEAMAQGVPAVVSDIPGPRELVRDGETGFLFPSRDAVALAERLERLHQDAELRRTMGQRARDFVKSEGLTTEACARDHLSLYKRVSAEPTP